MTAPTRPADGATLPDGRAVTPDPARAERRWWLGGVAVAAVFSVLGPALRAAGASVPELAEWTAGSTTEAVVAALAAANFADAARRSPAGERVTWWTFAAAAGAWSTGSALWAVLDLLGIEAVTPGPLDAFYLFLPVLVLVALLAHPATRARLDRLVDVTDGLVIAASIATILWATVLRTASADADDAAWVLAVGGSYPVADVILVALTLGLLGAVRPEDRPPFRLLAGGLVALTVADIGYLLLVVGGRYDTTPLATDAPYVTAFVWLAGAGALAARGRSDPGTGPPPLPARGLPHRRSAARRSVPIAVGLVGLVVAVGDVVRRQTVGPVTLTLTVAVVGLLLLRQLLVILRNRDLTASLQAAVERARRSAATDALTGLPNRVGLDGRIDAATARARADGRLAAVCFIDLDHLKSVNDGLGHEAGDELIDSVARRLSARLGPVVCRFGGDEFVAVVEASSPSAVMALAGQVVADGDHPVTVGGRRVRASCTVGVALDDGTAGAEELLRRADTALYAAKEGGRNRTRRYDDDLAAADEQRRRVVPALVAGMERGEFVPWYQPVFRLGDDALMGAEVLLRWEHPERGTVLPAEFLDVAASEGLLVELGRRSLQRACRQFAGLGAADGAPPLRLSVNLSADELAARDVVPHLQRALTTSGLDPSRLAVEVHEDVIVDDAVRRTLDRVRALGVAVAVDDFGAGNASLRQLGAYRARFLKLDRSVVVGLGHDSGTAVLVGAVVRLGHALGMTVVAEGVETEAQRSELRRLGCDGAQGWLYGRAEPFEDFVARWVDQPGANRRRAASAPSITDSSSSATVGSESIAPTT